MNTKQIISKFDIRMCHFCVKYFKSNKNVKKLFHSEKKVNFFGKKLVNFKFYKILLICKFSTQHMLTIILFSCLCDSVSTIFDSTNEESKFFYFKKNFIMNMYTK